MKRYKWLKWQRQSQMRRHPLAEALEGASRGQRNLLIIIGVQQEARTLLGAWPTPLHFPLYLPLHFTSTFHFALCSPSSCPVHYPLDFPLDSPHHFSIHFPVHPTRLCVPHSNALSCPLRSTLHFSHPTLKSTHSTPPTPFLY